MARRVGQQTRHAAQASRTGCTHCAPAFDVKLGNPEPLSNPQLSHQVKPHAWWAQPGEGQGEARARTASPCLRCGQWPGSPPCQVASLRAVIQENYEEHVGQRGAACYIPRWPASLHSARRTCAVSVQGWATFRATAAGARAAPPIVALHEWQPSKHVTSAGSKRQAASAGKKTAHMGRPWARVPRTQRPQFSSVGL